MTTPPTTEEWKSIVHYPRFKVSSHGRVMSSTGKILKIDSNSAYPRLTIDGKACAVHKMEAEAFYGPKPEGCVVDHIDGNKRNNILSNLEYVSKSKNSQRAWDNGLSKGSSTGVIRTTRKGGGKLIYYSLLDAANDNDIERHRLSKICNGVSPQPDDFIWEFEKSVVETIIQDEVWKPWPFCPTLMVSDKGRVRNSITNRYISQYKETNGYMRFSCPTPKSLVGVHCAVAATFVINPDPSKFDMVDHIDSDKTNNHATNLRWVDCQTNIEAAHAVPVVQMSADGKTDIMEYKSIAEASRQTGVERSNISACCRGISATAHGFGWSYKDTTRQPVKRARRAMRPVVQMSLDGQFVKEWPSTAEASRSLGIEKRLIFACCHGRSSHIKQTKWRFVDASTAIPKKGKGVTQFSLSGELIRTWLSMKEAATALDIFSKSISACCSGKAGSAGDFVWRFTDVTSQQKTPVIQMSITGEQIKEWPSATEAGRVLCISSNRITMCCRGETKTFCTFRWKYAIEENIMQPETKSETYINKTEHLDLKRKFEDSYP